MDAKCQVPADSVHKLPKINASGTRQACFLKLELRAFASATKQEATSKGSGRLCSALWEKYFWTLCADLGCLSHSILFVFSVYKLIQIGLNCLQLTNWQWRQYQNRTSPLQVQTSAWPPQILTRTNHITQLRSYLAHTFNNLFKIILRGPTCSKVWSSSGLWSYIVILLFDFIWLISIVHCHYFKWSQCV